MFHKPLLGPEDLPADVADLGPAVVVCHVAADKVLVDEDFGADRTGGRGLPFVNAGVFFQVGGTSEALTANRTQVRPYVGVRPHMVMKRTLSLETLATHRAEMWSVIRMTYHMPPQVIRVPERLHTGPAGEWPILVLLQMLPKEACMKEALTADATDVRPFVLMRLLMHFEVR